MCVYMCVCVYLCVYKREREREVMKLIYLFFACGGGPFSEYRKKNINPPLDFKDYRRWLKEQHETDTELGLKAAKKSVEDKNEPSTSTTATTTTTTTTLEAESKPEPKPKPAKEAEPAYPSSFAHIVELITNNQPIPGIEEIPDTVLSGHDEPSKAAKRRKPWETSTS